VTLHLSSHPARQASYNNSELSSGMSPLSPTAEGFRVTFRLPAIPFAEIAWRWSFAAAVWFLGALFLIEYADSLPVDRLERLMVATRLPALVLRAIHRIFRDSAVRFTEAGVLLAIALTIAWIVLASFGHTATLKALIEEFGIPVSDDAPRGRFFASLLALNFLRATVAWAALIACLGTVLLASSVWASTHISVVDAVRLCLAVLFFAWLAWAVLNWFLSLTSVFIVTGRAGILTALASTIRFCQEKIGPVLGVGAWFGLAHLGAFIAAWMSGFVVLGAIGTLRIGPVFFLEFALIAGYCVIADFLYTGRLAAYVAILRSKESSLSLSGKTAPTAPATGRRSVDQDELILSDVPLPAI
jgi:hypothetical protein